MKEKIIAKATEMFLKLGFKSVTMDDIACEMCISKKTIYKFFMNKELLIEEGTEKVQTEIKRKIVEIQSKEHNAIEENFVIKHMLTDIFKKSNTSPMYQLQKYYPNIYKNLVENEFLIFKDCVGANIRKGINEGLYRKDINEKVILKFYFVLQIHYI